MTLTHIIMGAEAKKPLHSVSSAQVEKGKGIVGDRYYYGKGTFNKPQLSQNVREISLISYEALAKCNERLESNLNFVDLRRNLVIKNMDQELLKNVSFSLGSASFKIVRTAPPCRYLSRLLKEDIMIGLKHIGGLRAIIIDSGKIEVGNELEIIYE